MSLAQIPLNTNYNSQSGIPYECHTFLSFTYIHCIASPRIAWIFSLKFTDIMSNCIIFLYKIKYFWIKKLIALHYSEFTLFEYWAFRGLVVFVNCLYYILPTFYISIHSIYVPIGIGNHTKMYWKMHMYIVFANVNA